MRQHRRSIRLALLCPLVAVLVATACDDDDGGDPTPTPPAIATTPAPATSPTASASTSTPPPSDGTPGPAETITITATPQELVCDGVQPSVITARVVDSEGRAVDDGTRVNFSVVTLGSVDPVNADTVDGEATTTLTALAQGVGVVINVTAGNAAASARVDCL